MLALEGVALWRGGRLLFEGLDLALRPGEAAVVTGPNGVGKSSLLRLAAGLLAPAAGRVARSAPVALADEALALDLERSVRAALGFWARLDRGDADAGLAAMELDALGEAPVRLLSTGQRKRAALARVVASGSPLWLLDEPLNGLDAAGGAALVRAIAAHRAGGGALLAASHQPLALPDAREIGLAAR